MNDNTLFKAHPVFMYNMLKRFVFVLILPVLKGAVQYVLYRRISGVILLESVALIFILFLSVWRLVSFRIVIKDDYLYITDGVIIKKRAALPIAEISTITVTANFILDLLKAKNVSINTESGIYGKKDFSFKLYKTDVDRLLDMVYGKKPQIEVRFTAEKIALLSATASSELTGLIVGGPIIYRLGKLLNIGVLAVLNDITELSKSIKSYFPPVVNAITIAFIAVYGVSFLVALARNMFFRISVGGKRIEIKSGLYYKRQRTFLVSSVKDVCIAQTPLMRAFRIYTMRVGIGGYGGENGEKSTVVPAMTKKDIKSDFSFLFPVLNCKPEFINPKKDSFSRRRFLLLPNIYALLIFGITAGLIILLPSFERLFLFGGLVSLGFDLYFGFISVKKQNTGGISFGEEVVAKGISGYTYYEMYTKKNNIGKITVKRYPVDVIQNTCRVSVAVRSESADKVKVLMLPYNELKKQIEKVYGIKSH